MIYFSILLFLFLFSVRHTLLTKCFGQLKFMQYDEEEKEKTTPWLDNISGLHSGLRKKCN
jgi:hypothetical protein